MLNENIKGIRKSKGLSQQELAVKLNVVRQTVSKWEQGLSVPDAEMLISLSEVLETPVSTLLGKSVVETEADGLKAISEKLEVINLQLARRKSTERKIICGLLIALCATTAMIFSALILWSSPYLAWDYSNPETAVLGVAFHSLEWLFVRVAPGNLYSCCYRNFLHTQKRMNEINGSVLQLFSIWYKNLSLKNLLPERLPFRKASVCRKSFAFSQTKSLFKMEKRAQPPFPNLFPLATWLLFESGDSFSTVSRLPFRKASAYRKRSPKSGLFLVSGTKMRYNGVG